MLRGVLEVIMKNTLPVENEAIKVGCKQQRECDFPPEGILQHLSHLSGMWRSLALMRIPDDS